MKEILTFGRLVLTVVLIACGAASSLGAAEFQVRTMSDDELAKLKKELDRETKRRSTIVIMGKTESKPKQAASQLSFSDPSFVAEGVYDIDNNDNYSLKAQWLKKSDKIQDFYLRNDALDSFAYLYPFALLDGRGATLSYTNNQLSNSQNLQVKGFSSYVFHRDISQNIPEDLSKPSLGGTAMAAYMAADGTLGVPFRPSERNALQIGLDSQAAVFSDSLFSVQNFGFRPYYQTDFRFEGSMYGFSALYEAYKPTINLGSRTVEPQLVGVLFRVLPEFNYFYVDEPGRSSFLPHNHYAWLGGTLQARAILFEEMREIPDFIRDRFYINASVTKFWSLAGPNGGFHDAQIEAGYMLTRPKDFTGGGYPVASLSFAYSNGRSRLTFDQRELYRIQLSIQY